MSAPEQPPKLGPSWVPQNAATPPEWKQPPTPKPGMPKAAKITLGIIGGLVLIGGCNAIITGGKGTDSTPASAAKPAPAPTVTVTVTQTVAAAAAPAVTVTAAAAPAEPAKESAPAPGDSFDGSGTYLVGDDIQPGTYKTAGPRKSRPVLLGAGQGQQRRLRVDHREREPAGPGRRHDQELGQGLQDDGLPGLGEGQVR